MSGIIITKLDVLDRIETVKVATTYQIDDERVDLYPVRGELLARCRPQYREFSGWERPTTDCRSLTDLPAAARKYLEFLEQELGALIVGVSVGKRRDQMIWTDTGGTS